MAGENYSSYKLLNTDKICKMKCKGTSECCDMQGSVWWHLKLLAMNLIENYVKSKWRKHLSVVIRRGLYGGG